MDDASKQMGERQISVGNLDENHLIISCEYELNKSENINFLLDYSKFLSQNKLIDTKIKPWQIEKTEILHRLGVYPNEPVYDQVNKRIESSMKTFLETKKDRNEESEDEFFKFTEYGNISEDDVVKKLIQFKPIIPKFLQRKKKREDESEIKNERRKLKSSEIHFEVVNSIVNRDNNLIEDSVCGSNNVGENPNTLTQKPKRPDSNMIIKNISSFNDETFENIIKEFLNINDFPTEPKDKVGLLKKFIPIYKKIKSDKSKLGHFLLKISDKLFEPIGEIKILFEFEYLRNKKDCSFSNLSKLISKLVNLFKENKFQDIRVFNRLTENSDVSEKFNQLKSKVESYLENFKDVM